MSPMKQDMTQDLTHDARSASSPATQAAPRPWWREPWPWLLMAGPAAAVIGCVITIVLAVQNFSDEGMDDGGVRQGLVVSRPAPPTQP